MYCGAGGDWEVDVDSGGEPALVGVDEQLAYWVEVGFTTVTMLVIITGTVTDETPPVHE